MKKNSIKKLELSKKSISVLNQTKKSEIKGGFTINNSCIRCYEK